jgi:hypothetical protein
MYNINLQTLATNTLTVQQTDISVPSFLPLIQGNPTMGVNNSIQFNDGTYFIGRINQLQPLFRVRALFESQLIVNFNNKVDMDIGEGVYVRVIFPRGSAPLYRVGFEGGVAVPNAVLELVDPANTINVEVHGTNCKFIGEPTGTCTLKSTCMNALITTSDSDVVVEAGATNNCIRGFVNTITDNGTNTLFDFMQTVSTDFDGFVASPTTDIVYSRNGRDITVNVPLISGTSNATDFESTGVVIPVIYRPPVDIHQPIVITDNSTLAFGTVVFTTAGNITFHVGTDLSNTSWTAAGTKGCQGFSATWIV